MKIKKITAYLKNIILPCIVFSFITGTISAIVILGFKWLAGEVISLSEKLFAYLRSNPTAVPIAIALTLIPAFIIRLLQKIEPQSKGGGIASAIAFCRGLVTFKWLTTMLFTVISTLFTFLIGTPLGNEGPSVLSGACIGKGTINVLGKKNRAWERYAITGGACAGFAVATNAPVSGVLFAIEEAHHRISPMITLVAGTTVVFAVIASNLIASYFGINLDLFQGLSPIALSLSEMWIPALIGVLCGLLSVGFIKLFELLFNFLRKLLKRFPSVIKMFFVFAISIILGTISPLFIGTGHGIIDDLLVTEFPVLLLLFALVVRTLLIGFAKNSGIAGGTFIPVLALGAIFSSLIAHALIDLGFIGEKYYETVILLGMTACYAGMTRTPLTAVMFSIEALALQNNILCVLFSVIICYMITELFNTPTINDLSMESQVEEFNHNKQIHLIDTFVTAKPHSFAINKAIRDILWPNNTFILSIKHAENSPTVDEHGENLIKEGDILHVRYSTFDTEEHKRQLLAIVGEQDYMEYETTEN